MDDMYPKIGKGAGPGPEQPAETPADQPAENAGEVDSENAVGETALLPKSILAGKGLKPGDTLTLKVVHLYDDEVEVAFNSEKPAAETEPEPEDMSADQEIDRMSSMKEMA